MPTRSVPHTPGPAHIRGFDPPPDLTYAVAPSAPVIDDFNRPDFTAGGYSQVWFANALPNVVGNAFQCNGGSSAGYWNANQFHEDSEATITLVSWAAGGDVRVGVRLTTDGTSPSYYAADARANGGITIIRSVLGVETTILNVPSYTLQAGDKLGIRAIGSRIELWVYPTGGAHGWVFKGTVNDSVVTGSGYVFLYLENASTNVDDLSAQIPLEMPPKPAIITVVSIQTSAVW